MTSSLCRSTLPALAIATLTLACSGSGSSPTAPLKDSSYTKVSTPWGSIALFAEECGNVDTERIVESVRDGYARAAAEVGAVADSVVLDGMTMRGRSDLVCSGTAAYGCYYFDRDEILFRCGYENVVEHELQHRLCDRLEPGCDCLMVDHAGGTDLNCQPI